MNGRPHLGRAGAGALIAVAVLALTLAGGQRDVIPAPAQPYVAALRHHVAQDGVPFIVDPGTESRPEVPAGRPAVKVPILMYHYIRINPDPRDRLGFDLSVTPADFTAQMDWLQANGYHPVDLNDLRGYLLGHGTLPDKPVVLTFDDGYRDMYTTAFPILHAHHFKGVAYIVSGFLNSPYNVTSQQVVDLEDNGIQIASHTVSHVDLTRVSAGELYHQLVDSKIALETLVGHPIVDFCYPSGRFNDAVARAVEAAGYQTATTTQPGIVHSAGDRFLWTRVRVDGGEPLSQFVANLGPAEATQLVKRPKPPPGAGPLFPRLAVTGRLLAPRQSPPPPAPVQGLTP
jgi:peptidoglycan/xylan/chitin deacetylase (PgdA/CDA1 family)